MEKLHSNLNSVIHRETQWVTRMYCSYSAKLANYLLFFYCLVPIYYTYVSMPAINLYIMQICSYVYMYV